MGPAQQLSGAGGSEEPGRPMTKRPTPAAHSQSSEALHRANRVRRARSELKTRIADGQLSAAEVILSCPSEITSMPIAQLLACQRGWGGVRSRAFLAQVALREDKSIGSLTERQRRTIASRLTRTAASATPPLPPRSDPLRGESYAS
jgi:hypothetical protein